MHRRLVLSAILTLALAGVAQAELVGYWRMDDGSGTVAQDSTTNARNGTLVGGPTWAAGKFGGAVQLDGTDDYVSLPIGALVQKLTNSTFMVWTNWSGAAGSGTGGWQRVFDIGNGTATGYMFLCATAGDNLTSVLRWAITTTSNGNEQQVSSTATLPTGWHHVAVTIDHDKSTAKLWLDGVVMGQNTTATLTPSSMGATTQNYLGKSQWSDPYFKGTLDDFRIYDEALADAGIQKAMSGYSPFDGVASSPSPEDKATDVVREVALSWTPGAAGVTHNVYLGTNFDDVNNATTSSALLVSTGLDASSYDPPGRLDFGATYYWRVDEVNTTADHTTFRGSTWSFTVEPFAYTVQNITATASSQQNATAGPQNTVNGSGLTGDNHDVEAKNMWLSGSVSPAWIKYDLGSIYKLHEMWVWNHNTTFESMLGFGIQNATVEYSTDGTAWTKLGDFEFAQAPGEENCAHNTTVPFGGAEVRFVRITSNGTWGGNSSGGGLSEVRFLNIPVLAREPQPATNSTNVDPTTLVLGWRSGREAASHSVYMGTDANALTLSGTATTNSFAPASLSLGTKYYWRVDEVNAAELPTTWAGNVWNFTTPDYLVVDDMESYNDTTNRVFDVWVDGYGTTTNGSVVGYGTAANETFNETTTIHGGKQSMPLAYGQSAAATSEATRTFDVAQDWTGYGVKTLVLFFYGDPANTTGQLYVKINNTKVTYTGDAGSVLRSRWNQWSIDLASVSGGVKAVKTLTIGISSGTGTLYLDDICLYKTAPVIPTPVDPGTTGLIAYYAMSNNVQDSSGKGNNGTLVGAPAYMAGLSASNMALKFNGTTDAVDLGKKDAFNPTGSLSVAFWANIGAWGTAWNHVMIGNRGEDNLGWQIRRHSSTSLCFTTRGVGNDDMASKLTPPQNEWIHITCVYNNVANTKTIYVNGIQDSVVTTTVGAKIAATTHNTYIGARAVSANTGTEAWFTGMLDEIRIFNRALTAGEADFLSKP